MQPFKMSHRQLHLCKAADVLRCRHGRVVAALTGSYQRICLLTAVQLEFEHSRLSFSLSRRGKTDYTMSQ